MISLTFTITVDETHKTLSVVRDGKTVQLLAVMLDELCADPAARSAWRTLLADAVDAELVSAGS